jgi:hypothetical protein
MERHRMSLKNAVLVAVACDEAAGANPSAGPRPSRRRTIERSAREALRYDSYSSARIRGSE